MTAYDLLFDGLLRRPGEINVCGVYGVETKVCVIQVGNDQVTHKALYYPKALKQLFNIETYVFSRDKSGFSEQVLIESAVDGEVVPSNFFFHLIRFLHLMRTKKPTYLEVFLSSRPWFTFYYSFVAKLLGVKTQVWCRGEVLNWHRHHWLKKIINRWVIRQASVVFVRELYMENILRDNNAYNDSRTYLIPNAIPPIAHEFIPTNLRKKKLLFLNSFKSWRNVDLLIHAAKELNEKGVEFTLYLVGSTYKNSKYNPSGDAYESYLRQLIGELGLCSNVVVEDFDAFAWQRHSDALLFLLPADIVFCNHSLLEAMARGIVPIVAEVEGHEFIVQDGVDGFVAQRCEVDFREKILECLSNDSLNQVAQKAVKKVDERYSVFARAKDMKVLLDKHIIIKG